VRLLSSLDFSTTLAGTWIVSPHSDDAALSLAFAISIGLFPAPVRIVTVFSCSAFSHVTQLAREGDAEFVTALRMNEDANYAKWAGVEAISLGLADAPLRPGFSAEADLFDPAMVISGELVDEVVAALNSLTTLWHQSLLVLPAAIGAHIDHRTVAAAGGRVNAGSSLTYADQPYALLQGRAAFPAKCSVPVWTTCATTEAVATKSAAATFYQSQPASSRLVSELVRTAKHDHVELLW